MKYLLCEIIRAKRKKIYIINGFFLELLFVVFFSVFHSNVCEQDIEKFEKILNILTSRSRLLSSSIHIFSHSFNHLFSHSSFTYSYVVHRLKREHRALLKFSLSSTIGILYLHIAVHRNGDEFYGRIRYGYTRTRCTLACVCIHKHTSLRIEYASEFRVIYYIPLRSEMPS